MTHETGGQGRISVRRAGVTLAALLVSASMASAEAAGDGARQCSAVGGTVMTTFVGPDTTLGAATGGLAGATSARLLGAAPGSAPNTVVFSVEHTWTSEEGDVVEIAPAQATATEVEPGLFAILDYPVRIAGGTGRFKGASGSVRNIGAVDLRNGRTVFRYHGEVCFRRAAR